MKTLNLWNNIMAKVTVLNRTERDVTIHHKTENELVSVTIPAGKMGEGNRIVPGQAEMDDTLLTAARKKPVVDAMFSEDILSLAEKKKPAEKQ